MLHLTRAIDRATGYVYVPPPGSGPPDATNVSGEPSSRPNVYSLLSTAAGPMRGPASDVRDVQERWVDAREQWDAYEKVQWRKEGESARNVKSRDTNV
jgi:hypothetical protein